MRLGLPRLGGRIAEQRAVFLHVPKCGGTSISEALHPLFAGKTVRINATATTKAVEALVPGAAATHETGDYEILRLRERLVLYYLYEGRQFVDGHVPFVPAVQERFPGTEWITVLREPVARWISHYFFDFNKVEGMHGRITTTLEEHLASPYGLSQGNDFVKFVGGPRADGDYRSKAAVARAKANLDRIAVVGLLEDLPGLQRRFAARFGPEPRIEHRNAGKIAPSDRRLTPEQLETVRRLCAPDLEVYGHAKQLAQG